VRHGQGVGPLSLSRRVAAVSHAAPTPAATATGARRLLLRRALAVEVLTGQG
jgi:hypothetical protein